MQKGYYFSSPHCRHFPQEHECYCSPKCHVETPEERRKPKGGCLPFTCTNHLVHGVGKWFTKLRTGKFRPRIACTICTNQFHLDSREDLKLVSKMALKEWNTNFRLEYSIQKNKSTFQMFPLLLDIFHWENPKSLVPFIFQPDFPENFCKW